jgi:hypothetical protein
MLQHNPPTNIKIILTYLKLGIEEDNNLINRFFYFIFFKELEIVWALDYEVGKRKKKKKNMIYFNMSSAFCIAAIRVKSHFSVKNRKQYSTPTLAIYILSTKISIKRKVLMYSQYC